MGAQKTLLQIPASGSSTDESLFLHTLPNPASGLGCTGCRAKE